MVHEFFEPYDLDFALRLNNPRYQQLHRDKPNTVILTFPFRDGDLQSNLRPASLVSALQDRTRDTVWRSGYLKDTCPHSLRFTQPPDKVYVIAQWESLTRLQTLSPIQRLQRDFLSLQISNVTPSAGGKCSEFALRQRNEDYFLCGRPYSKAPVLPPTLYSRILAEAVDARSEDPDSTDEMIYKNLESIMPEIYDNENTRMVEVRRIMNQYGFQFEVSTIKESVRKDDGRAFDIGVEITLNASSFLARYGYKEGKNRTGAEAFFEGLLCYRSGCKIMSDAAVLNSNFPALLTTVIGNCLSIYVCSFVERPISQLVCEYTFGYDRSDENQRLRGLRTIHVLTSTLQKLEQHYTSPSFLHPGVNHQPEFPYPRSCKATNSAETIAFTYDEHLYRDHRLFKVSLDDGGKAVIKYAQQYGKDAHLAAEKVGFAPKLLGLPWPPLLLSECRELLRERLTEFHATGFVHGDLRPHNILVSSDGDVKAIDWDWGGLESLVKYPRDLNRGMNLWRPEEVDDLKPILQAHDQAMLENFIDS
ncbi:hypothetical protein BT96DRAFT_1013747 [Gymnopus androsaceus JB14]|uniref:Uncharacterized protein n=1 Tax=Gymnopus androsaceus JB14 TaxID=1447944 RepID=A0A6A4IGU4_9AGAR|nr:hypothetical protein BT96DRAFT_1013747 [Gymnopus androsaceus JB14]